jgi:hypothetical protein
MNAHIAGGVIKLDPTYGDQTTNFSSGGFVIIYDNSGDLDSINNTLKTTYLYEIASLAFTSSLTQITLVDNTVNTFTNFNRVHIGVYGTPNPSAADVFLGEASHAEGISSRAMGEYSHAAGNTTEALGWYQSVVGQYNQPISTPGAFIVGDGVDESSKHNLLVAAAGNVTISGSLMVSGSSTFRNIGLAVFTGSVIAQAVTGSFTGSFTGNGSGLTGIVSSKWTGSNPISRQSDVEITGSLRVQGSISGSLFGTASWANNSQTASYVQTAQTASYILNAVSSSFSQTASFVTTAQTASYVLNAVSASFATSASRAVSASFATTASYILNAVSASYATTASYALNGGSGAAFPYTGSALITGSLGVTGSVSITQNVTSSRTFISSSNGTVSGSTLTVYGSGSAQPVFTVQGSQGELFSVTDVLSGSLFSVNDISGLPILEVFSDSTTLIGNYLDPMLITTAKVTQTNSGSFVMYSLPTASYDTAFFEYSVRSGSNARAGTIMAIQSGSAVNFTEVTSSQFGSTSAISFVVIVTGSNMALTGSSTSGAWTIKTIVRGI